MARTSVTDGLAEPRDLVRDSVGRASGTPASAWPPQFAGAGDERLIRAVAAITLVYSLGYIVWRWGFTLNPAALWFAIPLALAETYGLATSFFMTLTAWRLKRRVAPPPPAGCSVDVFVTCYDEPLTVIRKTVLAAREIRYPHRTWILDDGKRDELRNLASEFGVDYLRREGNEHAKAGNLNHALGHSEGDFILQLDADHVPLPHILDRLLGFMRDARVAFAQSPQDFYNTDAFTYEVNEAARRIWEDQQLFFRVIQPGKDRFGAAFFVGSCAVIRRAALKDIGGFATHTITEDIETSLLLHARGWKSVFYAETLAYGLAPGSAAAFHTQHLRWGQGAMQALRRYRPLSMGGLTPLQRMAYFDSLTTYLGGFQRLIFYLAPPLFFLTGVFPVRASAAEFLVIFVPYILLQMLSFKLLARGHGSLLLADRYGMAKFFTHMMAVTGYFARGRLSFRVTPKGVMGVPFGTYAPQLVLAAVTTLAVAWGVVSLALGRLDYAVPGWGSLAFWINLLFALWTITAAVLIVEMSMRLRQKRHTHRHPQALPVRVRVVREGRGVRDHLIGVSEDLNPSGLGLRTMRPIEAGSWVEVALPLSTSEVHAKGRVVHHRDTKSRYGTVHVHGIEFVNLPWADRDAIELHCSHHAMPHHRQQYSDVAFRLRPTSGPGADPRRAPRESVGVAARVTELTVDSERFVGYGLWEDTSRTGARVVMQDAVPRDSRVRVEIPGTDFVAEGTVIFAQPLAGGGHFVIGLQRARPGREGAPPRLLPAARIRLDSATDWLTLGAGAALDQALRGVRTVLRATAWGADRATTLARGIRPAAAATGTAATAGQAPTTGKAPAAHPKPAAPELAATVTPAPELPPAPEPAAALLPAVKNVPVPEDGDGVMNEEVKGYGDQSGAQATDAPPLVSVRGGGARMTGTFDIDDSIEIRCELSGELNIGGRLVIEVGGAVEATVQTVDAIIRGSYSGDLVATGTVHIATGGRVTGNIRTEELVIDRGGFFSGSVSRLSEEEDTATARQPAAAADRKPVAAPPAGRTRTADIAEPVEDAGGTAASDRNGAGRRGGRIPAERQADET